MGCGRPRRLRARRARVLPFRRDGEAAATGAPQGVPGRLRRDGPDARPAPDGRGEAPEPEPARARRDLLGAPDDAALRVPDGVGELRDRGQPGQAQHLRLPGPRLRDVHARPRHGPEGAGEVPLGPRPHEEAADPLHARGHVVLGPRRAGRHRQRRADRAGDVPGRRGRALGPARRIPATRHPRHRGDLLLLGHRPLPRRGREHGVRRDPGAARVRERGGLDTCWSAPTTLPSPRDVA